MPGGTPAEILFIWPLGFLHKHHVAVQDGRAAVLHPAFRLGGLANAGWAEEDDSAAVVVDEGGMELDHVALDGVGEEDLVGENLEAEGVAQGEDGAVGPSRFYKKDIALKPIHTPFF